MIDDQSDYSVVLGADASGIVQSVVINDLEYTIVPGTLNIVVYSNATHRVIDHVSLQYIDGSYSIIRCR